MGIFFVTKKDTGRLRLIVDARRSNLHFCSPPGVDLVTAEGLAKLEVDRVTYERLSQEKNFRFCLGTSDVKDAFHRFRIDRKLSAFFCLQPVRASEVRLCGKEVGVSVVGVDSWVFPAFGSLPMGFTWSLYFCQRTNESIMGSVPRLLSVPGLSDM